MLRATLQKMAANSGDKKDSIQFRVEEDEVEAKGDLILGMRRFDYVKVRFQAQQGRLTDDGRVSFADIEFQSVATSLSLCVTETGIIATITFSTEESHVFSDVIKHNLRNQVVELTFEEGENPYKE